MQYQVRQKKFQKGNEHPKFYVIKRSFRFALLKMFSAPPACAENMVFIVNILKSLSKQLLIIHKKGPQICKSEAPRLYRPYFFYLVENECSLRIAVTHFPLSSSLQIVDCFQQLLQFWFVYFLVENLLGIYVFV